MIRWFDSLRFFSLALIWLGMASYASAQSAGSAGDFSGCKNDFSVGVRDSFDICPSAIRQRMLEGRDPPQQWIIRGGSGEEQQSGAYEMGSRAMIPTGLKNARGAMPHYESAGCDYHENGGTKPGGDSVRGAREACNSSGSGEPSFGPPDISLLPLSGLPGRLTSCITGLFGAINPRSSGGCVSAGVNICGMGSLGGNICAGTNGIRVNGNSLMTGVNSINISGAMDSGPAAMLADGTSALRGPISVAGDTMLELANGTQISVLRDSVISTTQDNWLQIRDAAGNLLSEFDLTATGGPASLRIPSEGADLDPGALNANNYTGPSAMDNALPACFTNRGAC